MVPRKKLSILMADDDEDDRMLTKEALEEGRVVNDLHFVANGIELLAFLRGEGDYADRQRHPMPGLILLDLNMPMMDGREVLNIVKRDPQLKRIPVVVLTTSKADEDMLNIYDLGAASYITKPVSFESLVELMQTLGKYWIEFVELPALMGE